MNQTTKAPASASVLSPLAMGVQLMRRTGILILVHVGALAVFWTDVTLVDLLLFLPIGTLRGLVVTVGLHRYFSHRCFKTSRVVQFFLAVLCCLNLQNGPLWWAAVHRHHHRYSDKPEDFHSPVQGGFFWSHLGWIFRKIEDPNWEKVRDLRRYPELVWLERFWLAPSILVIGLFYWIGGWSMVCVDFFLTAAVVMHLTFAVNSLGHMLGSRRYVTHDDSRNSFILALFCLGDGWHNNHHHYPHSAEHGFFWWEVDTTFNVIRLLAAMGLVWDVRRVPPHKLHAALLVKEAAVPLPRESDVVVN